MDLARDEAQIDNRNADLLDNIVSSLRKEQKERPSLTSQAWRQPPRMMVDSPWLIMIEAECWLEETEVAQRKWNYNHGDGFHPS